MIRSVANIGSEYRPRCDGHTGMSREGCAVARTDSLHSMADNG